MRLSKRQRQQAVTEIREQLSKNYTVSGCSAQATLQLAVFDEMVKLTSELLYERKQRPPAKQLRRPNDAPFGREERRRLLPVWVDRDGQPRRARCSEATPAYLGGKREGVGYREIMSSSMCRCTHREKCGPCAAYYKALAELKALEGRS